MKRNLDETDRAIVHELQQNSRLSNKELAARVALSASSCHDRVKRLWKLGVLGTAYTEVLPSALGISIQALIGARLLGHTSKNLEAFCDYVLDMEEVIALHHVTGAKDFFLRVAVRDSDHLRRLVIKLSNRTELEKLETFVILSEHRRPLPDLVDPPHEKD